MECQRGASERLVGAGAGGCRARTERSRRGGLLCRAAGCGARPSPHIERRQGKGSAARPMPGANGRLGCGAGCARARLLRAAAGARREGEGGRVVPDADPARPIAPRPPCSRPASAEASQLSFFSLCPLSPHPPPSVCTLPHAPMAESAADDAGDGKKSEVRDQRLGEGEGRGGWGCETGQVHVDIRQMGLPERATGSERDAEGGNCRTRRIVCPCTTRL